MALIRALLRAYDMNGTDKNCALCLVRSLNVKKQQDRVQADVQTKSFQEIQLTEKTKESFEICLINARKTEAEAEE